MLRIRAERFTCEVHGLLVFGSKFFHRGLALFRDEAGESAHATIRPLLGERAFIALKDT